MTWTSAYLQTLLSGPRNPGASGRDSARGSHLIITIESDAIHVSSPASMTSTILLRPRPYAQYAGSFFLVALLPSPKAVPSLPSELWSAVFNFVASDSERRTLGTLLTICKQFTELVLPLIYARVHLSSVISFAQLVERIHWAEQRWDSIRRISYSKPGRWVQSLDLSGLEVDADSPSLLLLDTLLVTTFPMLPFLTRLCMNPKHYLSRRAIESLAQRESACHLRTLEGIRYSPDRHEAALIALLRCCPGLQELELVGDRLDRAQLQEAPPVTVPADFVPLHLPHLRTLTILSVHSSSLLLSMMLSPLPSLRKLTLTPFESAHGSLISQFIVAHGAQLRSLILCTPKSWPTHLQPSPTTMLCTSLSLQHLSLERPLPAGLDLPEDGSAHPLQILSIPRPNAEFWSVLERMLPRLPRLRVVRARDVRWLRKGMGVVAQGAGVQGEMREWRRRLMRKGVRVMDADWKECE